MKLIAYFIISFYQLFEKENESEKERYENLKKVIGKLRFDEYGNSVIPHE